VNKQVKFTPEMKFTPEIQIGEKTHSAVKQRPNAPLFYLEFHLSTDAVNYPVKSVAK
jgi:hypothetical protein